MKGEALARHLEETRARLLAEVERVPEGAYARPPAAGRWCVAEVLDHLASVEERVGPLMRDVIEGRRQVRVGLFDRLRRLPPRLVARRLFRIEAPKVVRPRGSPGRTEVLGRLAASRTALLALIEDCADRDVSAFQAPHVVLGAMDLHGWAEMIGHHEDRHRRQIAEIRESLARA